jgi:hypothetical protein
VTMDDYEEPLPRESAGDRVGTEEFRLGARVI